MFIWSLLFSYNLDEQNNIIKYFVDSQTDFEPTVTACYQQDKNDSQCFSLPELHERKTYQGNVTVKNSDLVYNILLCDYKSQNLQA